MTTIAVVKAAAVTLDQALKMDWPSVALSDTAKTWILGQVWEESRFGSTPDWGTSNNWGAVMYHLHDGKFIQHVDHDKDGKPISPQFQAYDTQLDAARAYLRVLFRGAVLTAMVNGSTTDVARAMYHNGYFTGVSGTPEERIAAYAHFIDAGAAFVRGRLAVPDGAPDVETVPGYQEALYRLGLYTGLVDGIAGPKTKAAVLEFQTERHLKPDGIVGPLTQAELLRALATSA